MRQTTAMTGDQRAIAARLVSAVEDALDELTGHLYWPECNPELADMLKAKADAHEAVAKLKDFLVPL